MSKLAAGPGFEPRLVASKATVLPLDDPAMANFLLSPQSKLVLEAIAG